MKNWTIQSLVLEPLDIARDLMNVSGIEQAINVEKTTNLLFFS